MIRLAKLTDIDNVKNTAKLMVKEVGFILRPALVDAVRREELIFEDRTDSFCHYHTRKDGVSVIYEICVLKENRGRGIARHMINMIPRPIRLKCPVDNESNGFYKHMGFELLGTEPGKKRMLNIWQLKDG